MLINENIEQIDILGLNLKKLKEIFSVIGLEEFNANQVYDWLHNKLIFDIDQFINISKNFLKNLAKT